MDERLLVSIIIPTYNEEKVIGRLLASIKNQTYPNVEIIVVDDSSSDQTAQIAKTYTKKVFIRKHAERSIQRNFGASRAKGDFLFFVDADMELTKRVVVECVSAVTGSDKTAAVVIPEKSVSTNFWERIKAFERSFYNLDGDETTDAARFFRKDIFFKHEGYDKKLTGPEDWDLPERIRESGYSILRAKSSIYHYERIPNMWKLMKKKYYYAKASYKYLHKHKVSGISPKTVYFLRPVFYRNWKKLISNPALSISMFLMMGAEMIAGGIGYFIGRWVDE